MAAGEARGLGNGMSISEAELTERSEHPLDIMERLAALHEWPFDRADENEISLTVAGSWANYNIALTWLDEMESLHIACAFDIKVTPRQRPAIHELIAMINEPIRQTKHQTWHFDTRRRERFKTSTTSTTFYCTILNKN